MATPGPDFLKRRDVTRWSTVPQQDIAVALCCVQRRMTQVLSSTLLDPSAITKSQVAHHMTCFAPTQGCL